MSKRQAGRFAAQGRLDEAVACALINPWSPGSAEVLTTYGSETSLADLASRDQNLLLLSAGDAKRISEVMGKDYNRDCAERNLMVVATLARSVFLETLEQMIGDLIPAGTSRSLVIDMVNAGKLPDAKIDQVRGIVSFGNASPSGSTAARELDILAADIEKIVSSQ